MTIPYANIVEELAVAKSPRALVQRRFAQAGLGVLKALRGGMMTVEEAENDLFNLRTYQAARRRRLDRDLIEFLEWGMELDDVDVLAPEALGQSFDHMEELLLRVIGSSLGKRTGTP